MKNLRWYNGVLVATAVFIAAYWTSVFCGIFPVNEIVPGYRNWFMSFPVADFYIAISALISVFNIESKPKLAGLFGAMTGSGLIFLGLYALAYGHNTGLLYQLTVDEVIEICIKVYCLTAGPFLIRKSWILIKT